MVAESPPLSSPMPPCPMRAGGPHGWCSTGRAETAIEWEPLGESGGDPRRSVAGTASAPPFGPRRSHPRDRGRPVVLAAAGKAAELVRGERAGLMLAPEDPRALANAFLHAAGLGEDDLREMGERARTLASAFDRLLLVT